MNNPIVMLVLLGLLLLMIAAPFSALAMLMIIAFTTVFVWTLGTLIRAVFVGSDS